MQNETTPLLEQYWAIKNQHQDAIVFFRLGDFYEMFGKDAVEGSRILDLTLTARFKNTPHEIPMAGIPHHAAESYIAELTKAGKRVAIVEQTTEPEQGKIVQREVVRIITPSTTFSEAVMKNKKNNYCAAFIQGEEYTGLAFCDITTGDFFVCQSPTHIAYTLLKRLEPSEVLVHESLGQAPSQELGAYYLVTAPILTLSADETITRHFHINSINSFGLQKNDPQTEAAARLIAYLKETQKTSLAHIISIKQYQWNETMLLDETTIRNLELFTTVRSHDTTGSLFDVLDTTKTPMGGRMLRSWLIHPLLNKKAIETRIEAVENITQSMPIIAQLAPHLARMSDLERISAKIGANRVGPRDLHALRTTCEQIPQLCDMVSQMTAPRLQELNTFFDQQTYTEPLSILNQMIADNPPALFDHGGVIRKGYSPELDEWRDIAYGGKEWLSRYQEEERKKTGIENLKIKFNKIFGYFIEISKGQLTRVPDYFERRQTLVNAERYITPDLKIYEEKVLTAEEKILTLEREIFDQCISFLTPYLETIQNIGKAIAEIDVYCAFAHNAISYRYTKPNITSDAIITIRNGRHPVIEKIISQQYIPNDLALDSTNQQIIILTGPNMSGKSSYLRQNALIVLMAQIGSFVPADHASISIVDRIFTRVGASDDLSRGQSTFMVEMQEAAYILNNATDNSLVIFDELGRGTSTYDGVSIAWAVIEYFHTTSRTKILFATHYHELIELGTTLERCKNYCVLVKENEQEGVLFLHQVMPGGIDKSYGIEVARLAGLPKEVILQAKMILTNLEQNNTQTRRDRVSAKSGSASGGNSVSTEVIQPHLFSTCAHQNLIEQLKNINPNTLTPIEAIQKLDELKQHL